MRSMSRARPSPSGQSSAPGARSTTSSAVSGAADADGVRATPTTAAASATRATAPRGNLTPAMLCRPEEVAAPKCRSRPETQARRRSDIPAAPMETFSDMKLPAPLAEAIAARGYDRPTAVQAAVAGPEHAGRDLLVSSETGSGKTLAFGVALADALLADATTKEHAKEQRAPGPRALVITPTRELATQVRDELGWLYGKTKARIAVFTGGTDVRRDLAQLRPGVDLVVGTPGRLVD